MMRDAPHITKWRALDSQSPIWCRPGMEITASSFKLRASAPEGRKAISYQILNLHAEVRRLNAFAVHGLEPTANPVVRAILANPARSFVCHLLATFSVAVGTGLCRNIRVVVRLRFQCWWGFKYVCPAHIGTLRYNVDLRNTQHSDLCVMVRIHARQPSAGWRTLVRATRSHPRKGRPRDQSMRGSHPQDGGLNPVPRAANLGKIAAVPLPPCPPHAGIDHGFIESLSLDFLLPQRRVSALPVRSCAQTQCSDQE